MRYQFVSSENPVLVIADDDIDVRAVMQDALRTAGYAVEPVECGASLLARLTRDPDPTLVVTDLKMPRIDGLDVLERAARMGLLVPAILCTAFVDDEVRERARELDVPILAKPLEISALRQEVRSVLRDWDFWREPEHDGVSEVRPRARPLPW